MKKIYYVAYGSNLHEGQMAYRCPGAFPVGTSMLENWRLIFKGSKTGNYATIEPCKGESVPVAIWELKPEHILSLDRYEGFPVFYQKQTLTFDLGGEQINAFVYTMRKDAEIGFPSAAYIKTLEVGYETFGFDKNILYKALRISMR